MLIDKLIEEWEKDCVIDEQDISGSALKTPNLHAKYLKILIDYKLKKVKATSEMSDKRLLKSKYFKGHLTTEELNELGWQAYQFRALKGDIDELLDADPDIQKIKNKIEYCNSAIYLIESVLQEIKSRSFHTRVAMDWIKFRAGM
jgi:hypothetical protein